MIFRPLVKDNLRVWAGLASKIEKLDVHGGIKDKFIKRIQ